MTMLAVTVCPGVASTAELGGVDDPHPGTGDLLCETIAVGVDGTDAEIVHGLYGEAPPGRERLILGHESLGRVMEAPRGSPFAVGDLVVAFVRRPDPEPCEACAAGEWDMCRNGRYTEHGIKGVDGFLAERFRLGISGAHRDGDVAVASLNKRLVLNNNAVVGSVNANRRHYEAAVAALAHADRAWLDRLVSRWVPLDRWAEALERREDDVKVVVEVAR